MAHHKHPFSLTIFLADGIPDGLKTIEKSNWNGCGLAFPRSLFREHRHRPELTRPGVYLLLAQDELGNQLYIGEGDPMIDRLEGHFRDKDKDWWESIIAFTVKDRNLHKAYIQFLEAHLIKLARDSGRFTLKNGNNPSEPTLSETDRAICEGFLSEMLLCLPILGVHLTKQQPESADNALFIDAKGVHAEARECPEGFLICKGSFAVGKLAESKTIPAPIQNLRNQLLEKGILISTDNEKLQFAQDYLFGSPSTASAIVLGHSSNGREAWKNQAGISLKTLQTQGIE